MQDLEYIFIPIVLAIVYMVVMKNNSTSNNNTKTRETSPATTAPAKQTNKQKSPNGKKAGSNCPISVLCRRMAGSNWDNAPESKPAAAAEESPSPTNQVPRKKKKPTPATDAKWTKFVAMDCEMVGVGSNGQDDMLARVSIVNENGDVLIDKYVKAQIDVVDYRTRVSGIRPHNMDSGEEFLKVQQEVRQILYNKVLVGHSVRNDLAVLGMKHPYRHIRDTAKYRPLAKLVSNGATPSLKRLAKAILGMDIQSGEHSSVEDARATMLIYKRFNQEWEKYLKRVDHRRVHHAKHRS